MGFGFLLDRENRVSEILEDLNDALRFFRAGQTQLRAR